MRYVTRALPAPDGPAHPSAPHRRPQHREHGGRGSRGSTVTRMGCSPNRGRPGVWALVAAVPHPGSTFDRGGRLLVVEAPIALPVVLFVPMERGRGVSLGTGRTAVSREWTASPSQLTAPVASTSRAAQPEAGAACAAHGRNVADRAPVPSPEQRRKMKLRRVRCSSQSDQDFRAGRAPAIEK